MGMLIKGNKWGRLGCKLIGGLWISFFPASGLANEAIGNVPLEVGLSGGANLAPAGSGVVKPLSKVPVQRCRGIYRVRTAERVVALTFDDGPNGAYTQDILAILRTYGIRATFFMVGRNVQRYPGLVLEAYRDGNVIGSHSYSHFNLATLSGQAIEDELIHGGAAINQVIGEAPLLFRPPYGACSARSIRVARNLGLKTILWNVITDDYHVDRTTSERIAAEILQIVEPGSIIVLHDGGGNRRKTVMALELIIQELRRQGYRFLTLPELLNCEAYTKYPYLMKLPDSVAPATPNSGAGEIVGNLPPVRIK